MKVFHKIKIIWKVIALWLTLVTIRKTYERGSIGRPINLNFDLCSILNNFFAVANSKASMEMFKVSTTGFSLMFPRVSRHYFWDRTHIKALDKYDIYLITAPKKYSTETLSFRLLIALVLAPFTAHVYPFLISCSLNIKGKITSITHGKWSGCSILNCRVDSLINA